MTTLARYFLSRHVHLCTCGDYTVLLDTKRDAYSALDSEKSSQLAGIVDGWPMTDTETGAPSRHDENAALIQVLLANGTITANPLFGRGISTVDLQEATTSIATDLLSVDSFDIQHTRASARHVLSFLRATIAAYMSVRFRPLEITLQRTAAKRILRESAADAFNADQCRHLLSVFRKLQLFSFTSRDRCLYDSLALFNFLTHFGIHAQWIFGVQMSPFSAHCWLQHENVAINETVEIVKAYTPIMII